MPKIRLTEAAIAQLEPSAKKLEYSDDKMPGLLLRHNPGGRLTWAALYYLKRLGPDGKLQTIPTTKRLGRWPNVPLKEAWALAKKFDPHAATRKELETFEQVAEAWLRDHVQEKRLRSRDSLVRQLHRYIYPQWRSRPITQLRRMEVNELLDRIKAQHGRVMADAVMSTIRGVMTFYEGLDEDYRVPIVKSMKRDKRSGAEKARTRTLDHDEIISNGSVRLEYRDRGELKAFWNACGEAGSYGVIAKLLLLTGQRLTKVARMRWEEVDADGVWTIRTEHREKGNAGRVQLPPLALDLLAGLPRVENNPHVFPAARGYGPVFSFGELKQAIDARLPSTMRPWVLHDLRRTARSLLARLGTSDAIAERVLGHQLQGVLATYNRHDYFAEKSEALAQLADLVERTVDPGANVVPLRR